MNCLKMEQNSYLRTTLTSQNEVHDEIKTTSNSGNASYHSVRNLLTSLLSRINNIRTVILPIVLDGCESWFLTLREVLRTEC